MLISVLTYWISNFYDYVRLICYFTDKISDFNLYIQVLPPVCLAGGWIHLIYYFTDIMSDFYLYIQVLPPVCLAGGWIHLIYYFTDIMSDFYLYIQVLPPVCLAGGWIQIKYLSFNNPGGKGANGRCCDGLGSFFCQKNGCDHYFRMCLAKRDRSV